jgi:hypothetical protein
MGAPPPRPLAERIVLRVARWLLWPVARLFPRGGFARIHRRLCELERTGRDARSSAPRRVVRRPEVLLALLLGAALVLWLHDVIRRPAPPPPARGLTAPYR